MKKESNKNWTTCLRLNTGDGSPRVFLLNSHFLGSVPKAGVLVFCFVFLPLKLSSGSHPVKLNSKRQKRRPLPVVAARLVPSPLRYSGPVIRF